MLRRLAYGILLFLLVVGALFLVRFLLEPKETVLPPFQITENELTQMGSLVSAELLGADKLLEQLDLAGIWLIGEEHFFNETVSFLLELINQDQEKKIALLLELPHASQTAIDNYLSSGDEQEFGSIWEDGSALPYYNILRWARTHPERFACVKAIDENSLHIFFMRLFLTDTRNQTMADAVLEARNKFPHARIVVYGGSMHMLKSGRYLYDVENRRPVGYRLIHQGVPEKDIASVVVTGGDRFPIHKAFEKPGAIGMQGKLGELPTRYFLDTPIFQATRAAEIFDVFVNLGSLTPCPDWKPARPEEVNQ